MSKISSHVELAKQIEGKNILLLNSLGKDAVLCLEWLNHYAKPAKIISLMFEFDACWIDDEKYLNYLKKRYPKTVFVKEPSSIEMNDILSGAFQSPVYVNHVINNQEYDAFSLKKQEEECLKKYGCDYLASGMSCYEGMIRAIMMRRKGLLHESSKTIYPIGLMKYKQVIDLIKKTGLKLNSSYKFENGSYDTASYFKMRYGLMARPRFKEVIYKHYPLMILDEYRFEVLFNEN